MSTHLFSWQRGRLSHSRAETMNDACRLIRQFIGIRACQSLCIDPHHVFSAGWSHKGASDSLWPTGSLHFLHGRVELFLYIRRGKTLGFVFVRLNNGAILDTHLDLATGV